MKNCRMPLWHLMDKICSNFSAVSMVLSDEISMPAETKIRLTVAQQAWIDIVPPTMWKIRSTWLSPNQGIIVKLEQCGNACSWRMVKARSAWSGWKPWELGRIPFARWKVNRKLQVSKITIYNDSTKELRKYHQLIDAYQSQLATNDYTSTQLLSTITIANSVGYVMHHKLKLYWI